MNNTHIHASAAPRNDVTNFTSFIFGWLKQVDGDAETSAGEFRIAYILSQMLKKETRVCFPLQATLAKRLGVSDRQLRTYLAGLEARGHLHIRHRGRDQSSIYQPLLRDRKKTSGHDDPRPEENFQSNSCDDRKFNVARPEVLGSQDRNCTSDITNLNYQSHNHGRGAPKARLRRAPSEIKDSSEETSSHSQGAGVADTERGVAFRAPPLSHLDKAIARARRLHQSGGII